MHLRMLPEILHDELVRRFFIIAIIICVVFLFISDLIFNPHITWKSIKRMIRNFSFRRFLYKLFRGFGL